MVRLLTIFSLFVTVLAAHPMGNFSISHYSRLELSPQRVKVVYVLDFAEIPTFELFQQWGIEGKTGLEVQKKAEQAAEKWVANLGIARDGKPQAAHLTQVFAQTVDGAAGMPQLRVEMVAEVAASGGGAWTYEDRNFTARAGWKEMVIQAEEGVTVTGASHRDRELSQALTAYPTDLSVVPPQDLRAWVNWTAPAVVTSVRRAAQPAANVVSRAPAPVSAPPAQASFAQQQAQSVPGTVVKGDFLSRMLKEKNFTPAMILFGLLAAFGLGAMHALSPGHGKTIVAAYLVGSRGTLKHAAFLGFLVTFTHTASVFLLGLGVLFFEQYVVPEKIIPALSAVSGISIVLIGAWLLYQRSKALLGHQHHHHHHDHGHTHHHQHDHHHEHAMVGAHAGHHHDHPHAHSHPHPHPHPHAEEHSHDDHGSVHTHTHDGHTHSHAVPEGKVTFGGLIALGISGGLVPCPSALVLLLSAIALGQVALGLLLLTSFSAGLALVLMAIGGLVIYAKNLLPEAGHLRNSTFFRLVPIFSAVVVMVLGLLMTLVAVGVIPANRFIS